MADLNPVWHIFGAVMRQRRQHAGLSLREVGDATHVDLSVVGKWERGVHRPDEDAVITVDGLVGAGGDLVALYAKALELDRRLGGTLHQRSSTRDGEDDDMERRAAIQLLAALGTGALVPPGSLETVLAGIERSAGVQDTLGLDDWERTVRTYGQLYYAEPPSALIGDLTADLISVSGVLKREQSPSARAGLQRVSARLAALMATDFSDAGNQRPARLTWQTARRAADVSGDRDLSVWVRAREADCAFWQNRPHSMISDMLDDAMRHANGSPSVGLAVAHEVQAKLLAMRGEKATATAALQSLTTTFEKLPSSVTAASAIGASIGTSYPEALIHRTTAYVYAFLGDKNKAPSAVDQAIASYPPGLTGGNLRLIQALAHIHQGQVEDGLSQAVTIAGGVARLTPMRHMILGRILAAVPEQAHALPAAQELRALAAA
ncbi:multiprotein-bridging factor 1 family protein [Spongiactinospora sp. 9N601]|uniref:multiprotein-bridging factor 1 family protein n=1 Tax=Spongiactinospora sp. 9N601 TaxID=3375149 RepID=UPI0037AD6D03